MRDIVPGRLRTFDSACPIALERVRSWVQLCNKDHRCNPLGTPLPTRVLDLGPSLSSTTIKLIETHGQGGKYVALSHCWGVSHRTTTTSLTLEAHKSGISASELPRTFQDAVTITQQLGVQYLWIDSLCIIQDSRSDWEVEASKMGDVYVNSFLTIAASSSADDSTGCFTRRTKVAIAPECHSLGHVSVCNTSPIYGNPRGSGYVPYMAEHPFALLNIPYKTGLSELSVSMEWMPTSTDSKPRLYEIGSFGRPVDPLQGQHLNSRAWTLQERLLSPRTIHYAEDQMYWQCKMCFVGEDGSRFNPKDFNLDKVIEIHQLPTTPAVGVETAVVSFIDGYPGGFPTAYGSSGWLSYVENYSRRSLTVASDRLPALSGIASLIAKETADTYHAGCWMSHVLEDLNWRVYAREEHQVMASGGFEFSYGAKLCDVRAPEAYRAPSWSWASIEAFINFLPLDSRHLIAVFHSCHTDKSGIDPFGAVSGGWIKIWVSHRLILE
jgi:hypothetical protein